MNIQYICEIECAQCRVRSKAITPLKGITPREAEKMASDVFRVRGWYVGTCYYCPKHAKERQVAADGSLKEKITCSQWLVLDNLRNHWPYNTNLHHDLAIPALEWAKECGYVSQHGVITDAGIGALISCPYPGVLD